MFKKSKLAIVISGLMLLSACGGSSDNSPSTETGHDHHDHDHQHEDNIGRLAISEHNSTTVRVRDIKSGNENKLTLAHQPSGLYGSASHRFLLALSRDNHSVEIFDGGLYKEPHGDHDDLHAVAPTSLLKITTEYQPTHYRTLNDRANIFFDGKNTLAKAAAFYDFSDDDLINAQKNPENLRHYQFPTYMHGVGEPLGTTVLAPVRAATAKGVLPSAVAQYDYDETSKQYTEVQKFADACPSLHGAISTNTVSAFGCSDGVLLISRENNQFTATHIKNPAGLAREVSKGKFARVGGFDGVATSGVLAAWASGELWALNIADKSLTKVDWTGGDATAKYSTAYMDDEGKYLLVLDTAGNIHVLDVAQNFKNIKKIHVIDKMPNLTGHAAVGIVASPRNDDVYIVNSDAKQIAVLNLHELALEAPIQLDFVPEKLAWLGFTGEAVSH